MVFTIIGVAGAIGSGKSFTQLKHGLKYVEERQKQLVTNFPINIEALRKYASLPKEYVSFHGYIFYEIRKLIYALKFSLHYAFPFFPKPKKVKTSPHLPWVKRLCEQGGIIQIPAPKVIEALLIPESVVLLDEAGILLNSREFAKTSKQLLADLAQSRKDGCDLIWCAQFDEQVDRQLRLLTQFWIHCESLSVYDKKMRRPKLFYKRIFWFRCSDYIEWQRNTRVRGNHIKTRLIYATIYEGGLLSTSDKYIFNIYDSFKRLDKEYDGSLINTIWQCRLPYDYYFNRLPYYEAVYDPLSRDYDPSGINYYKKEKVVNILESKSTNNINSDLPSDKSELIRMALKISRDLNTKPPYLKDMDVAEIKEYILKLNKYYALRR